MTQQQAQTELQEIEKIADAILRGDKYFDGSRISCDKYKKSAQPARYQIFENTTAKDD